MRKFFILLLSVLLITLVACGNEEEMQQEPSNEEVTEEETNEPEEVEEDLSVDIEEQTFEKFVNSSFSAEVVGVYAKLTNNGDDPVSLYNVQTTFYDSNDDIIYIEEEDSMVSPSILSKGDSGYLAFSIDYDDNLEDLDQVEITYDVQEIDDSEIKNIEVSKVNVLKDDGFFVDEDDKEMFDSPISDAIKVLFNIENEHDEELGYMLGIGFYDKDGTFIGASNPMQYIGEDFTMQSNNSKNMEEMEFLPVDYEDIDDVDIRIIGVPFDNE